MLFWLFAQPLVKTRKENIAYVSETLEIESKG